MGVADHKKKRIGWMGGSFNPIHFGHLVLAEFAREVFRLDKVLFIPNGNPGYPKEEYPIPGKYRFDMIQLAIQDHPQFEVTNIEINRQEICYTIDTLHLIEKDYPRNQWEYFFITGLDTLYDLPNWKEPLRVLQLTDFIAGSRPGFSPDQVMEKIKDLPNIQEKVHFMEIPLIDISSSDIRERIRLKKTIRYLVPDLVIAYIKDKQLYQ